MVADVEPPPVLGGNGDLAAGRDHKPRSSGSRSNPGISASGDAGRRSGAWPTRLPPATRPPRAAPPHASPPLAETQQNLSATKHSRVTAPPVGLGLQDG